MNYLLRAMVAPGRILSFYTYVYSHVLGIESVNLAEKSYDSYILVNTF